MSLLAENIPKNFDSSLSEVLQELIEHKFSRLYFLIDNIDRPVNIVLIGGTGVGKSTIFNTLLEKKISKVSRKRATTFHPVMSYHPSDEVYFSMDSFLPNFRHTSEDIPQVKGCPSTIFHSLDSNVNKGLSFIDVPDFDSVFEENAKIANTMFDIADVVLFVFDTIKYKDKVLWRNGVQSITQHNTNIVFILNKVSEKERESGIVEDFEKTKSHFGMKSAGYIILDECFPDSSFPEILPEGCKQKILDKLGPLICPEKVYLTKLQSSSALYKFLARETGEISERVKNENESRSKIMEKVNQCYEKRLKEALEEINRNRNIDNKEIVKIVRAHLGSIVSMVQKQMLHGAKRIYCKIISFISDEEQEFKDERNTAKNLIAEKQAENLELLFQLFFELEKELDPLFRENNLALPQNRDDFFSSLRVIFHNETEQVQHELKKLIFAKKERLNWKGKVLLNSLDGVVLVFMLVVSYFYIGGIGVSAGEYLGTAMSTLLGDKFFTLILGGKELDEILLWLEDRHRSIYKRIFSLEKERIVKLLSPSGSFSEMDAAIADIEKITSVINVEFQKLYEESTVG